MVSLINRLFSSMMPNRSPALTPPVPMNHEVAFLAAGCFWGVEHLFRKKFPTLDSITVGYIGGKAQNPSYAKVCGGNTGHAEAIRVVFDPKQTQYRDLVEYFYRIHDPTTLNYQGNDHGTQYRSAIFTTTPTQLLIAQDVTKRANEEWWKNKIVTEIAPAKEWWTAEEYHQKYLIVNPGGYNCHILHAEARTPLSRPEKELSAEDGKSEL